jgi:hypothetical protein
MCSAFGRCLAFPELLVAFVRLWEGSSTETPVVYTMVVAIILKLSAELREAEVG